MEFEDEHDEEQEEEEEDEDEEEITIPPPQPPPPQQQPQPGSYNNNPLSSHHHHPPPPNHHRLRRPTIPTTTVRYRECLKNHAVTIGGHAVDGCGEFMPAGEQGTLDALKCAACNCHRNFHRKETEPAGTITGGGAGDSSTPPHHVPTPSPGGTMYPQFSAYYRTPAAPPSGFLHVSGPTSRPLAVMPSTSHSGEMEDPSSSGGGGGGSGGRKRFRTKFSQEQKDKMLAFAEKVGWRIQKHDEAAVQQFCAEVQIRRQVLKVWMHNNKHTLGKKP